MNILSIRGILEQGACLDALISVMLDSSANQMVMLSLRHTLRCLCSCTQLSCLYCIVLSIIVLR